MFRHYKLFIFRDYVWDVVPPYRGGFVGEMVTLVTSVVLLTELSEVTRIVRGRYVVSIMAMLEDFPEINS